MATKAPPTRPGAGSVARVAGAARTLHARNRLLTLAGWSLTAGLGFGVPIVVVLRLWLGASWWWGVPLGLASAALLGTGVFVFARRWSLAHAAGEVDRANETDGALRTAIEIDDRDGEPVFVAMARRRGESIAAQADPAQAVPPARFEGWRWAAGAAAACVLAGVFVPQIERRDPGARAEVSPVAQRAAEEVSTARAETEQVEESALPEPESWSRARAELEALEEELRRGDADEDAAARTAAAMDRAAEELERQNELAARREQELSDRAASFDRADPGRGGELSERLADALARNDMLRAEEIAREIDRTAPTLSEAERRELSDALEDLASRLEPDEPDADAPDQDQPAGTEERDPPDRPRPETTPDDPADPSRPTEQTEQTADPTEPPPGEDPARQDPDRPTEPPPGDEPPRGDDPERRDQQTDDPRRDQQQDQQQNQQQQGQQQEGQQQEGQDQQAEEQQGQQQGQQQESRQQEGQEQQGQEQQGQEQPGGEDPERPGDADAAERPGEEGTRGERDPSRSVSEALRERARELRDGPEQQPRPDPAQDAETPQPEPGEGPDEAETETDQGREEPAERPDPDQPTQPDQPGREQGAREQPDPNQPGDPQPGDPQPGEGRPDGEQPGEQDGQAPPGSLERAVRQIREQRDAREQNQRVAESLRQRARDLIDPADRAPGGPGEDETRLTESDAAARPVEFEPVDASGTPDPDAGSRVVGEWFDPDRTEMPAAERMAAADELRRAAGRARDAVENQQVPRHRRELVQRVFERLGRRAEEVGSGSTVAPQGRDANP